ncbi:hypothetical protein [Litorihabitans aurantiacus]|nr:hypothetical protein [Litorihabitans aurantiacus]
MLLRRALRSHVAEVRSWQEWERSTATVPAPPGAGAALESLARVPGPEVGGVPAIPRTGRRGWNSSAVIALVGLVVMVVVWPAAVGLVLLLASLIAISG